MLKIIIKIEKAVKRWEKIINQNFLFFFYKKLANFPLLSFSIKI